MTNIKKGHEANLDKAIKFGKKYLIARWIIGGIIFVIAVIMLIFIVTQFANILSK